MAEATPTYQDLIDLLDEAEASEKPTAEVLATMFCEAYPHIPISRPARLLETARRIAGPIRKGSTTGSAHTLYLRRTWTPRIRNSRGRRVGVHYLGIWVCTIWGIWVCTINF